MNQNEWKFRKFCAKLNTSRQKIIKIAYLNPSELTQVSKILQDMAESPTALAVTPKFPHSVCLSSTNPLSQRNLLSLHTFLMMSIRIC